MIPFRVTDDETGDVIASNFDTIGDAQEWVRLNVSRHIPVAIEPDPHCEHCGLNVEDGHHYDCPVLKADIVADRIRTTGKPF